MAVGHQDMEGWGVYSIFKEAGRLLYQHTRILRPFILAFLLPLALILFLEVIGIPWVLTWVADQVQPHHLGGISGHHRHSVFHAAIFKAPNLHNPIPVPVFVLLIFLIFTISWLLVSLATAAIAKAIHHIYSTNNSNTSPNEDDGNSSSQIQTQSIFSSLPYSLYRIFIISLCFLFVVDILTYILLDLPFLFLLGPQFEPYDPQALHTWLWNLVFLILHFWFLISVQVVVLESEYKGWTVLHQSVKLVKAKATTALGLLAVYFVYLCILDLVLIVASVIQPRSVMLYVVAVAVAVGYLAFWAFWSVVVTVFYFVSKCKWSGGGEREGDLYQALDVVSPKP